MKFCFIVGAGRSGTTLVQTLLDCHPECAVWPFEFSPRELWYLADKAAGIKSSLQHPRAILNKIFLSNERVKNLGSSIAGSAAVLDTKGFDRDKFIKLLRRDEHKVDTPLSYLNHLGGSFRINDNQQVFVVRHNDLPHDWYHLNIPGSFHIIALREPIENYLAYQRFRIAAGHTFVFDPPIGILTQFSIHRVFQGFWAAEGKHELDIPVRLEDISKSPVERMNMIADRLGIRMILEWNPSVLGNPFSGNSTRGKGYEVKNFALGYSRRLTRNEHNSFMKFQNIFESYYPDVFKQIKVASEKADIAILYNDRFTDGMRIADKQLQAEWYNIVGRLRVTYRKKFYSRINKRELKALISMDVLLPDLVESPSWRSIL